MTRKQALSAAIEALNAAGQTEAAEILHKLSGELPFFSWSEDAIYDAVEQFILDHGQVPTTTDFKKRGLPPHTVIKRRFGLTIPPRKRPWTSFMPRRRRTSSGSTFVSNRSAPRTITPAARIHPVAGMPSPSITIPDAGASCWRN